MRKTKEVLELEKKIKELEVENEALQSLINDEKLYSDRIAEELRMERHPDQSTMTILKAGNLLFNAYLKIKDEITAKEAFKQFVANIVSGRQEALKKAESDLEFHRNVTNELSAFTERVGAGDVKLKSYKGI